MVMKSIFTVSCFVIMALATGTEERKIHPVKLINLLEDMDTTCRNLTNGTCQRINKVVFTVNCTKEAYQDTFCQINRALHKCKDVSSALSDFHDDNCTSTTTSFIGLEEFCSDMLLYIDRFYRKCATIKKN